MTRMHRTYVPGPGKCWNCAPAGIIALFCLALALCIFAFLRFRVVRAQTGSFAQSLLWEAQTGVPDEYPGKALPSPGARIRVFAQIAADINPDDLIVRWSVDGTPVGAREPLVLVFPVTKSAGDAHTVRADIQHRRTRISEDMMIRIPVVERTLHLYRISADGGVTAPVPDRMPVSGGQTLTFLAQAYFFPVGVLRWRWTVDGRPVTGEARTPHILTLSTPAGPLTTITTAVRATAQHSRYNDLAEHKDIVVEIR